MLHLKKSEQETVMDDLKVVVIPSEICLAVLLFDVFRKKKNTLNVPLSDTTKTNNDKCKNIYKNM